MSGLERQLEEDRVLRDAALALFKADLALVRAEIGERGLADRIKDRIGESTLEMVDEAVDYAEQNRGQVAALAAAVVLWFARGPIIDAVRHFFDHEADDPEVETEPGDADSRSDRD